VAGEAIDGFLSAKSQMNARIKVKFRSYVDKKTPDIRNGESKKMKKRDIESLIEANFKCPKCGHQGAQVERLAMAGTGLSRLFEIQHHRYAFSSCLNCGYSEVYNLRILEGQDNVGSILEVLFAD
jgi:predicted nucleic-acid-binding Zn-ribbon protein